MTAGSSDSVGSIGSPGKAAFTSVFGNTPVTPVTTSRGSIDVPPVGPRGRRQVDREPHRFRGPEVRREAVEVGAQLVVARVDPGLRAPLVPLAERLRGRPARFARDGAAAEEVPVAVDVDQIGGGL